jgi:hypothetical protein
MWRSVLPVVRRWSFVVGRWQKPDEFPIVPERFDKLVLANDKRPTTNGVFPA